MAARPARSTPRSPPVHAAGAISLSFPIFFSHIALLRQDLQASRPSAEAAATASSAPAAGAQEAGRRRSISPAAARDAPTLQQVRSLSPDTCFFPARLKSAATPAAGASASTLTLARHHANTFVHAACGCRVNSAKSPMKSAGYLVRAGRANLPRRATFPACACHSCHPGWTRHAGQCRHAARARGER